MSLWITGDTHGFYDEFMQRIAVNGVAPGDTVIVCGDFGFIFSHPDNVASLIKLKKEPYLFCFADGNHEDFNMLSEYPTADWNGGRVHRVSDNILHLMRGNIFDIMGQSFFVMGCAFSVDKAFRTEGYSWLPQELPSAEEYDLADRSLAARGMKVDNIVTHTAPFSVIRAMGFTTYDEEVRLDSYFDRLKDTVDFGHWYFGHFHHDRTMLGKYTVMMNDMIKLA